VAQVSDLHVGPQVSAEYLGNALRKVSALNPDMVVVTGDFMSAANDWRVD
jgi:3',5'-cyclic AMP phosphodiesterase CpdA